MDSSNLGQITQILAAAGPGAVEEVFPLVYEQLRALAARHLLGEKAGHTLQPTAVVNELYLRLQGESAGALQSRGQFFAVAGACIRHILVDHARKRGAAKRGGDRQRVDLDTPVADVSGQVDLLDLDQALSNLAAIDPRRARIAELRLFTGLDGEELAAAVGLSRSSVVKEWRFARAWLARALSDESQK